MKSFIIFLFLSTTTFAYAQTDSTYLKQGLTYVDYMGLESSFFVHLKRKPTYAIGGVKTVFLKSTMSDIKVKIREHARQFPQGIVIITTSKGAKYNDFKDIIDFLANLKAIKYALMSRP